MLFVLLFSNYHREKKIVSGLNLFITGTDTNVGKTYVSLKLLDACKNYGLTCLGIKPIATGCERMNGILYNNDALALQQASTVKLDYEIINPLRFEPPIAPHIAAAKFSTSLTVACLKSLCRDALNYPVDVRVIEGVGGWFVPLNQHETMADFVIQMKLTVILVVGIRLGCLNHALLTWHAIRSCSVPLLGWVANCIDPNMHEVHENIETLCQWLDAPCLAIIPFEKNWNVYREESTKKHGALPQREGLFCSCK